MRPAVTHELRKAGPAAEQQCGITVIYDGIAVGQYFVDLLVEQAILFCLLMNFSTPRLQIRRIVLNL